MPSSPRTNTAGPLTRLLARLLRPAVREIMRSERITADPADVARAVKDAVARSRDATLAELRRQPNDDRREALRTMIEANPVRSRAQSGGAP
jgi:hypothetical protein